MTELEIDEVLDDVAADDPLHALREFPPWLSGHRLDACALAEPAAALLYAFDLLTPERRTWCAAARGDLKHFVPDRLELERRRALGLGDGSRFLDADLDE
jgi:hypothetical protein